MIYLLDSSVLIDVLNNRNGRPQFLSQLSEQGILLACCSINVTELYMGMRSQDREVFAEPGILPGHLGSSPARR